MLAHRRFCTSLPANDLKQTENNNGRLRKEAVSWPAIDPTCSGQTMHTRSSKPKDYDFATIARRVVEQTIGEKLDGFPLDDPNAGKNPAAVALGKLGGAKGGAARAAALSPAKRKAIAKKAAQLDAPFSIGRVYDFLRLPGSVAQFS
jgi:hypothetical protein